MKSILLFSAAIALAAAGAGEAAPEKPYAGHELAGQAHVDLAHAQAIALKVRPGTVEDRELENEGGGLRWSFDIKADGRVYEVGVDARSGKVLENKPEGKNPD